MSFWWDSDRWRRTIFKDLDAIIEEMLKDFEGKREEYETGQPYVYGFSFSVGPEGELVFREFGNPRPKGTPRSPSEEREPLVEVYEEEGQVLVVAEVPGVAEEDIQLNVSDDELEIKVDSEERQYYKVLELPSEIDEEKVDAKYTNGVLEVKFQKKEKRKKWKTIKVE